MPLNMMIAERSVDRPFPETYRLWVYEEGLPGFDDDWY